MAKTVILHAGLMKTGTTSIQHALYADENQKLLAEKGYRYLIDLGLNPGEPHKPRYPTAQLVL